METLVNPKRIIIKAEMLGIQKKKKKKPYFLLQITVLHWKKLLISSQALVN